MRLLIVCTSLSIIGLTSVTDFDDPARASQLSPLSAADSKDQSRFALADAAIKEASRFSPLAGSATPTRDVFELAFASFPIQGLSDAALQPELKLTPASLPGSDAEEDNSNDDDDAGVPLPAPRPQAQLCEVLASAAQQNDLPVGFLIRLIWQESRFNPNAVSRVGAQGLAQFMPRVAADVGLEDPFDPQQALPASARLLRSLYRQFGNLGLAAAAYNAGAHRIQTWLTRRGRLPAETRDYVVKITGSAPERWKTAALRSPDLRVPAQAPCKDFAVADVPLPPPAPTAQERAETAHEHAQVAVIQTAGRHAGRIKFASRIAPKSVVAKTVPVAAKAVPVKVATKANSRSKLVQVAMAGHGRR